MAVEMTALEAWLSIPAAVFPHTPFWSVSAISVTRPKRLSVAKVIASTQFLWPEQLQGHVG